MDEKGFSSSEILNEILKISGDSKKDSNIKEYLTLEEAKKLANRALEKAKLMDVKIVVSVVDSGGNLILLNRMDDSFLGSIEVSINKAYTALSFNSPTHLLKELVEPKGDLYTLQNIRRVIAFGGGYPIDRNGKLLGGIGISGGTVDEDLKIVQYAICKR